MPKFFFWLMIVLMVVWTGILGFDLVTSLLADQQLLAVADQPDPLAAGEAAVPGLLAKIWGPAGQARAIVWGLPMIVFAMIAAISQR
jgi:hypothetical protein